LDFVKISPQLELSFSSFGDAANNLVIFLHGIMGNKKNLTGFVQNFLKEVTGYRALIFDLRNHGTSTKHVPPFTVQACAEDIQAACEALSVRPKVIVGHSFGGKVALLSANYIKSISDVWLLDCPPGPIQQKNVNNDKESFTTLSVIRALEDLAWPVQSRLKLTNDLMDRGMSNAIAAWMTTNLQKDDEGFRLVFEPKEMKAMLLDFLKLDGWPYVSALSDQRSIHLVAAEFGNRVFASDDSKLKQLAGKNGYFHVLKNAGHFLHADNPVELIRLMSPYFGH
jgi:esterase